VLHIQPKLQVFHGKNVKNFKTFRKVFPLSVQRDSATFGPTTDDDYDTMTFSSVTSSRRGSEQEGWKSKIQFEVYNNGDPLNIEEDDEKVNRVSSPQPLGVNNEEDDGRRRGARKRREVSRKDDEPVVVSSSRMKRTVSMDVVEDENVEMEDIMLSSSRGQGRNTQSQTSTRSMRSNINASSSQSQAPATEPQPTSTSPQRPQRTKRPRLQMPAQVQESREDDLFGF